MTVMIMKLQDIIINIGFHLAVSLAVFAFASSAAQFSHHLDEPDNFLRCLNNTENTPKPSLIVVPFKESQVQTVIKCSNKNNSGLQMRVRSGGHDIEGSSYTSNVAPTLEENAVQLVHKSQQISTTMPLDLSFSIQFSSVISDQTNNKKPTVQASFICTLRGEGGVKELLSIMDRDFPELNVTKDDIFEMLWIQYLPFYSSYPINDYARFLTSRIPSSKPCFTAKSDFVKDSVPETGVQEIMNKLLEAPGGAGQLEWTFLGGGIMDKIPESEIPFPHRGYLFLAFEMVHWDKNNSPEEIDDFGRYVPNNPRPAYADYRDHDLGINSPDGTTTVEEARSTWGGPYFGVNFGRLVHVKSRVDPENFFRNEQSFPVLQLPYSSSF
ncbi:OLC1v1020761C1 [Oldenlandia corymbosa var. corymbosa]|uniref:OLC1v1020761C1 n=1 Tax=Oldenlandia corymbosa var. corymbosa TaxID=529605 RepID=A0AAV1BUT8_OLDCO|nr:OLC1v1020761C1 [Oldenlandia corymbosa var. corymbosa]